MIEQENIRNFCIISHIDHGKSTLADRMLEITGTVPRDKMHPQMLDMMELERERGITIKLQPVRMEYKIRSTKSEIRNKSEIQNSNNKNNSYSFEFRDSDFEFTDSAYTLNLIDTPGHVDFSYEVSRALKAVEGAVLLVDATKGIQAQTLANWHLACQNNLKIIPVINKIDLANAEIEKATAELSALLNIDQNKIIKVSAKTGVGVEEIIKRIILDVPAPKGARCAPLRALIFDSVYDSFRGVIAYVRVVEGQIQKGEKIKFLANDKCHEAVEVGEFKLKYLPRQDLGAGEIGYVVTGAKEIDEVQVGDTITADSPGEVSPIPGFKKSQSVVFANFYARGQADVLRYALDKLKLNDSSLTFQAENSQVFGQGFHLGFLGMLHLEIIKERLEREYNLDLVVTQPTVEYRKRVQGSKIEYDEPWVKLEIVTPGQYVGPVMELVQTRRGRYKNTAFLADRAILECETPLGEIVIDFYDKLKSLSAGYASQNYELLEWRAGDLVKLEVLIASEKIEEFSRIVPRLRAQGEAKNLALKLKNLIPRQMFEVSIQVAANNKILARENISAMKKNVTAKLYGGDRTRKDKLLKKQIAGKRKMKKFGRVEIPDSVFIDLLKS